MFMNSFDCISRTGRKMPAGRWCEWRYDIFINIYRKQKDGVEDFTHDKLCFVQLCFLIVGQIE